MKKITIIALCVVMVASCFVMCACTSDEPIVGTYKLVDVVMDNGTTNKSYHVGDDALITENSVVLNIKDNYRWSLSIQLPGVSETESGVWTGDNGNYALKEHRYDDDQIYLTYTGDTVNFILSEDGYLMNITLTKVS